MCADPKYLIRKKLLKMPGNYRHNLYSLAIKANRSAQTIEKWAKIDKNSKSDIPTGDIYILASFFKCNPNDLING